MENLQQHLTQRERKRYFMLPLSMQKLMAHWLFRKAQSVVQNQTKRMSAKTPPCPWCSSGDSSCRSRERCVISACRYAHGILSAFKEDDANSSWSEMPNTAKESSAWGYEALQNRSRHQIGELSRALRDHAAYQARCAAQFLDKKPL